MKHVLIVEDDPVWVKVFEQYCLQVGLRPIIANSPQVAMDLMDEMMPEVVILDLLLAAETGMALLNEMRSYADFKDIPIIVCTTVSGILDADFAPYGVKYVLDKATLHPVDMISALKELTSESE